MTVIAAADAVPAEFLALAADAYADDPHWIPESADRVRAALAAHVDDGRALAACVPGRARAAVVRPDGLVIDGVPAAFVGWWESVGDDGAEQQVQDEVERWARARGVRLLVGPVDGATMARYRLRTAAEPGGHTFPGEPYNPAHYPARWERLGWQPWRRYVTQAGPFTRGMWARKLPALDAARDAGFSLEPLDAARWRALLPELHGFVDQVFADSPGYTPLPYEAFAAVAGETYARLLCPHASVVALDAAGALAGFTAVWPQWGPLLEQGAGDARIAAASIDYQRDFKRLAALGRPGAIVKTTGVRPDLRGRGLMDAMAVAALVGGEPLYDLWLAALVRDDNHSRRFAAPHVAWERRYALYRKPLG